MTYRWIYTPPKEFSKIILESDGEYLTKLVFDNSKDINKLSKDAKKEYIKVFIDTRKWLDEYFKGNNPPITIKYKVENVTEFTKKVIDCIKEIPYGKTITYKDIATKLNCKSYQAIGSAVGKNPICIIIPCHRVLGKNNIGGFSGGINNKINLLKKEKIKIDFKAKNI